MVPVCDRAQDHQDGDLGIVDACWQPQFMGPRVVAQSQGNWLGAIPRGRISMANGRGEFTGPTMLELLVDLDAPIVMAVHTGQQVDSEEKHPSSWMRIRRIPTGTHLLDYSTHWLSQSQRIIHLLVFPTCLE